MPKSKYNNEVSEIKNNQDKNTSSKDEQELVGYQSFEKQIFGMIQGGHPLSSKITEKNISEIINQTDKQNERQLKNSVSKRRYALITFVLLLIFIIIIIFRFSNKPEQLFQILSYVFAFFGGGGIGYGLGSRNKR